MKSSSESNEVDVEKHPWKALTSLKMPHCANDCKGLVDANSEETHAAWSAKEQDKETHMSVFLAEVAFTATVLSFGMISFWYGTWTMINLTMDALYGTNSCASGPNSNMNMWKRMLTELLFGAFLQVLSLLMSRTRLASLIYRPTHPATWSELFARTFADRLCLYLQTLGGISIWAGIWDLWTFFILPDSPWISAAIAHVVGLTLLLCTFSFRSTVTPPMVFSEDSIVRQQLGSRWNLLSKWLASKHHQRLLSEIELQWTDDAAEIAKK